jgi:uncharacterized protein (DUF1501 family)
MSTTPRRAFLRQLSALGATGSSAAWLANMSAVQQASAQSTASTDYRALVCIFMSGGNDAHNTVVPTDALSWPCYSATRDPAVMASVTGITPSATMTSIALPQSSLLKINHLNAKGLNTGRTFGLHPQLKRIQALYTAGKAAIVANVGPLVQPVTKGAYTALPNTPLPRGLFSHNDQTSTWQSFGPEGRTGGWGGQMMDKLSSRNTNPTFSSVGINANAVWLNGTNVAPYMLGTGGFQVMGGSTGTVYGNASLYSAMRQVASTSGRTNDLVSDYLRVGQRALSSEAALVQGLPSATTAPWGTPGSATAAADPLLQYTEPADGKAYLNPLAAQLQMVARMIAARNIGLIGAHRQVFMVQLGGFDTHSSLMTTHASLMAKLDHAVSYFQTCLAGMPGGDLSSQVTTFTGSEFGRALINNGDGCDHGWGGHHFVIGGGVKGAEIHGHYPDFGVFDLNEATFFSDQLLDTSGALLPEISVDQYVYTLGKWMGVSEADLIGSSPGLGIAPNIQNFDSAKRDIGFMTA